MTRLYFRRLTRAVRIPGGSGRSPTDTSQSYLRRFWTESYSKALPWMLGIALVVNIAEARGYFERWSMPGLDLLVESDLRKLPTDIFIVAITNDDYHNLFHSTSPLAIRTILNLIDAVASAGPTVIGVDLDTRESKLDAADIGVLRRVDTKTHVVWAQVPVADPTDGDQQPPLLYQPTLGGQMQDTGKMGVVRFPVDRDGVVRKYEVQYDLFSCGQKPSAPLTPCPNTQAARLPNPTPVFSFPRAVVKAYGVNELKPDEEQYLNLPGSHYQYQIVQASEFLNKDGTAKSLDERQSDLLKGKGDKRKDNKGKIVLIGGTYEAARDEYQTSVGRLDGVELLAAAIESELHGLGLSGAGRWWEFATDLVLGTGVVLIYFLFQNHPWVSLWLALAALIVVPFMVSVMFFHFWEHWLSFVPVMAGMVLHQLVEGAGRAADLSKELKVAEARIEQLEAAGEKSVASVAQDEIDVELTTGDEAERPGCKPGKSRLD